MKNKMYLHNLGKAFKLFVLGSFVATRTASGAADPEESLRHETAWLSVRDRLADVSNVGHMSSEIRRMIEQEIDKGLDFRVNYTYLAIAPDEVAQLDTLWMDHLVGLNAGADEMDRFLEARTVALRQLVDDSSETFESAEQLRNVVREFSRGDYTE